MMQIKEIKAALNRHQPKIDEQYQNTLQLARYTNLSNIEKSQYLQEIGIDKNQKFTVFFIEGNMQNQFNDQEISYYFCKILDSKIDSKQISFLFRPYILIYFIAENNGSTEFQRFRIFLKTLPLKYYVQLHSFYVHHASLMVRTKLWFQNSKRGRIWLKRTTFIGDVDVLFNLPYFNQQWYQFIPKRLQTIQKQQQLLLTQEISQSSKIFGVSLNEQKLNQFGIPLILDHLIQYFLTKPDNLLKQDIFRKPGSMDDENQLFDMLNQEFFECLNVIDDVYIVCSMIKKYFTLLPEPLIIEKSIYIICQSIDNLEKNKEQIFIESVISILPNINRMILSVMVSFIIFISTHQLQNRMSLSNLAIVFAPCFIRNQVKDLKALEQIGKSIGFLNLLFNNFERMFPNFSFKLFLIEKQNVMSSVTSSNSSTGADTSNKNSSDSSDEYELNNFQQQQKQF